jgi:hypothetical protein
VVRPHFFLIADMVQTRRKSPSTDNSYQTLNLSSVHTPICRSILLSKCSLILFLKSESLNTSMQDKILNTPNLSFTICD